MQSLLRIAKAFGVPLTTLTAGEGWIATSDGRMTRSACQAAACEASCGPSGQLCVRDMLQAC
jgi:hypothetical protein